MTLSRRDRIVALAWSLPDALNVLTAGRPGEQRRVAPSAWQLCAACDGTGETRDRWGSSSVCGVCGGAGRYRTDPYVDGVVVSGVEQLEHRPTTRSVACDRCDAKGVIPGRWIGGVGLVACPTCDGTGTLHVPLAGEVERVASRAADMLAWQLRGGDWHLLDAALERMRSNGRRPLWRGFVAQYVEPPYRPSDEGALGLCQVELLLPGRVRVPAEVVTAWRSRDQRGRVAVAARARRMGRDHRNREIRAALRLGHSSGEVARMFAVSERTVQRIGS